MNINRDRFSVRSVTIVGSVVLVSCLILAIGSILRNQSLMDRQIRELSRGINLLANRADADQGVMEREASRFGSILRNQSLMDRQIQDLSRGINLLAKQPADRADAEQAVVMGREAIRKGQWEVGQLYFVNAVTNAPRHVAHLNAYATAVLEKDDIPLDALDRLSSVLQLAAYQVDSGDVPAVLALIEKAEQYRKRSLGDDASAGGQKRGPDLSGQWDKLSQVDPNVWKDLTRLTSHLKSLEDFISDLDEQEEPPVELRGKAAARTPSLVRDGPSGQAVQLHRHLPGSAR